ncbi:hypothetical protein GRF29_106g458108 [Pseudopithomyces chartarum]|uniref:Uncharacterized protein n=1 Tax=Pseudopithomyces chartarum TaxID=1892770 RepID=A0AAN6LV75_9PLEO|nr:hypothetical protein GRF29_106g458108 [Pseudopithomyces chartarum]
MEPSAPSPIMSDDVVADSEIFPHQPTSSDLTLPSDQQMLLESPTSPLKIEDPGRLRSARRPLSLRTLGHLGLDLLLAIPPICFLVYAFLIIQNRGKRMDEDPVPALQKAAKYGPTVFPIVFAAIIGNLLKAIAAWKLERGITVLSLEYLLSSRTVFSTVTTPLSLRTVNILTPCLVALWALSPLGGQAVFRVLDVAPPSASLPLNISYLEVMSEFSHTGPFAGAGSGLFTMSLGAFTTALSGSANVKAASQDASGNIKIPMIEALELSPTKKARTDWFDMSAIENCTYSAVTGIPVSGYGDRANYTFSLETSYMYTNCTINHTRKMPNSEWYSYMSEHPLYNNQKTLVIQTGNVHMPYANATPLELIFTSFTYNAVTNATCKLTTTYVEVQVFCHWSDCKAVGVRSSHHPRNQTALTVLDGIGPSGSQEFSSMTQMWFLSSLINSTNTPWAYMWANDPYSTPLEYYFTNPDSPYSAQYVKQTDWIGADIWPIGDTLFSYRFSQLLNTFWLANVAPVDVLGNFTLDSSRPTKGWNNSGGNISNHLNVTGMMTPDHLELTYHKIWLIILMIASMVMLCASLAAAVLGSLRRGPDILDHTSILLRNNIHAHVRLSSSMADAVDQARISKDLKVCVGDARDGEDTGYITVGTLDAVKPISQTHESRLYE